VDTKPAYYGGSNGAAGATAAAAAAMMVSDEISPTEVMNFPPPTPVKQRPSKGNPYASIRRNAPSTPIAERRRMKLGARTPHPGRFPIDSGSHGNDGDDDDCVEGGHHNHGGSGKNSCKSRFYGDFDVIGELGKGSFGTVYKVLSRLDGCMYAIKAAQRKAKGPSDRDRMLKEVRQQLTLVAAVWLGRFLTQNVTTNSSLPFFLSPPKGLRPCCALGSSGSRNLPYRSVPSGVDRRRPPLHPDRIVHRYSD